PSETYTLSLHDALPISIHRQAAAAHRADVEHPRGRTRAVERGGRRALDDLDALDVERGEVDARLREDHVVHHDQGCVVAVDARRDRKSTRLNSSHVKIS